LTLQHISEIKNHKRTQNNHIPAGNSCITITPCSENTQKTEPKKEVRNNRSYRPAEVDAAEQYHTAEPGHIGLESQTPVR